MKISAIFMTLVALVAAVPMNEPPPIVYDPTKQDNNTEAKGCGVYAGLHGLLAAAATLDNSIVGWKGDFSGTSLIRSSFSAFENKTEALVSLTQACTGIRDPESWRVQIMEALLVEGLNATSLDISEAKKKFEERGMRDIIREEMNKQRDALVRLLGAIFVKVPKKYRRSDAQLEDVKAFYDAVIHEYESPESLFGWFM